MAQVHLALVVVALQTPKAIAALEAAAIYAGQGNPAGDLRNALRESGQSSCSAVPAHLLLPSSNLPVPALHFKIEHFLLTGYGSTKAPSTSSAGPHPSSLLEEEGAIPEAGLVSAKTFQPPAVRLVFAGRRRQRQRPLPPVVLSQPALQALQALQLNRKLWVVRAAKADRQTFSQCEGNRARVPKRR